MWTAVVLCFLAVAQTFADYPYVEEYLKQPVDHFNFGGGSLHPDASFHQRYLVNDKAYKKGGPIVFYTGNEGDILGFWKASGFVFELAESVGGLIVFGEHRYYGKSLPFGHEAFRVGNVGYLTIEQALSDYAYLIKHIKEQRNLTDSTKVIALGGSYGGILSGFMRYKYPHIIFASVAASSPFYTTAGLRPRSEFFKAVTNTFHMADANCPASVKSGFNQLASLLGSGQKGYIQAAKKLNVCVNSTKQANFASHIQNWLRNLFTVAAMMDYPYPADMLAPLPANPVNVICKMFPKGSGSLDALGKAASLVYGSKSACHDIYKEYVDCADPTGCGLGNDAMAWDYQACTEMILPGGSNGHTDMFPVLPFTLSMRENYCHKRWGLGKSRNKWLATEYWATEYDVKQSSRIIFTNGDLDPWMPGGVLHDLTPTLKAFLVKGGAHHLDLRGSNPADPQSVRDVRKQVAGLLEKWLSEHK